jgi:hypothetical protein
MVACRIFAIVSYWFLIPELMDWNEGKGREERKRGPFIYPGEKSE